MSGSEKTDTIFSDVPVFDSDSYLEHYGVIGMKWGVRKDTKRIGSRAKKTVSKVMSKTAKISGSAIRLGKRKIKSNVQEYKENKKQAKRLGYKKVSDYKRARFAALYSHDPAVVARGMRTLTDKELSNKVKRLTEEKKIINLIPPKTKSVGAEALQTFARTVAATAGTNIGKTIGNSLSSSSSKDEASESNPKKKKSFKKASRFSNSKPSRVSKSTKSTGKSALEYYKDSPLKLLPGEVDLTENNNYKQKQ